jgi:hypothetical protein
VVISSGAGATPALAQVQQELWGCTDATKCTCKPANMKQLLDRCWAEVMCVLMNSRGRACYGTGAAKAVGELCKCF